MDTQDYKVFRDNVHGYIHVPTDFVRSFVDTDIFQRLRNIEQTGMRTLYPSARHDRFIHSLGTFHLGSMAFTHFRDNTKESSAKRTIPQRKHYTVFDGEKNEVFWDKCGTLFEIACLLHDCGHAPFSHTLEFIYEYPSSNKPLEGKLRQYISSDDFRSDFVSQGSQHERMSALVVCAEYGKNVTAILSTRKLRIEDDADDIEFIVRMIIGCKYQRDSKINRIKNCLISLLNSNSIDVDSLDYIVRDSKLSGIDNMSVDVNRLLSSLTLVEKTIFKNTIVHNASISTNILNGILEKTQKENAMINGQYQGNARVAEFDGRMSGSISATGDFRIKNDVKFKPANSNILKVGTASYAHKHSVTSIDRNTNVEIFGITDDWFDMSGSYLELNKEYNGKLNLNADVIEIDSAFLNGKISGMLSGELLGCFEDIGGTLICELGFHKSSLSVIQNVLVARNYEYQWIYSHHKVVYYSNYLIIELLRECIKCLLEKNGQEPNDYEQVWTNILSWENMIECDDEKYHTFEFAGIDFFRPIDSDILCLFKKCRIICMNTHDSASNVSRLLTEYYTRVYKSSLWKSFAEYSIFFNYLSENEKNKLYDLILAKSKSAVINQYGYFNDEWETQFNKFGMKNVVWVSTDSKLKVLNPDNTCILFKDTTLNYRTVSTSHDVHTELKMNFFYIYYEQAYENVNVDIVGVQQFMHEQLKGFI